MSTPVLDPVEVITALAENQLTEAIMVAAKKDKKSKTTKQEDPSIVDKIVSDLTAGKYAIEAAANLTRIFGREFEPIAEQILSFAKTNEGDISVLSEKIEPAKKPRAKKTKTPVDTSSENVEKPRAKKTNTHVPSSSENVEEVKKTKTPVLEIEDIPSSSENVEQVKKPRAKKTKTPVLEIEDIPSSSENVEQVKKPRAKKTKTPVESSSENVEKPRAKKTKTPIESPSEKNINIRETCEIDDDDNSVGAVKETKPVPMKTIARDTDSITMDEIDPELVGFTSEWKDELKEEFIEEELSDIEDE